MTAMHGYVTYFEYCRGSNKGASKVGDLIVNPFKNGQVDPNFTSSTVEEGKALAAEATELVLGWGPVVPGSIEFAIGADKYFDDGLGHLYKGQRASRVFSAEQVADDGRLEGVAGHFVIGTGSAVQVGTVTYGSAKSKSVNGAIYDAATPKITFTTAPVAAGGATAEFEVKYIYNNIAIAQNDLPTITVREKGIHLMAKARRVAVNYSQIAAFQAKQESGIDLGKELETVAIHTLKYEIDTEVCNLLVENAVHDADLDFNIIPRAGISLAQQMEGFAFTLETGKQKVWAKTQKFFPNYMLISNTLCPLFHYVEGFKDATPSSVNGPYLFGTVGPLKIYVTPNIEDDSYILGVNGPEFNTSAAVYAPYMAIVPTALLQTPDGANAQGWSTLYALEILNKDLLIGGKITRTAQNIVSGDIVRTRETA